MPSGWAQRLLCFAGTEAAAAAPGPLREQQEAKAASPRLQAQPPRQLDPIMLFCPYVFSFVFFLFWVDFCCHRECCGEPLQLFEQERDFVRRGIIGSAVLP